MPTGLLSVLALRHVTAKFTAKFVPGPMQARLHAAERDAGNGRDLPIAKSFQAGKIDNHPVPVRQGPQCCGEIGVQQATEYLVFGRAIARLGTGQLRADEVGRDE
jgi:hypothetical protein